MCPVWNKSSTETCHTTGMVSAMHNVQSTLYKAVLGLRMGCKIMDLCPQDVCGVNTGEDPSVIEVEEEYMNATDNM